MGTSVYSVALACQELPILIQLLTNEQSSKSFLSFPQEVHYSIALGSLHVSYPEQWAPASIQIFSISFVDLQVSGELGNWMLCDGPAHELFQHFSVAASQLQALILLCLACSSDPFWGTSYWLSLSGWNLVALEQKELDFKLGAVAWLLRFSFPKCNDNPKHTWQWGKDLTDRDHQRRFAVWDALAVP